MTCDVDEPDIRTLVTDASRELGLAITLVHRPHQGQSRSSQVRNNGIRAIQTELEASKTDPLLVFLDGDCCPAPDCFATHAKLAEQTGVVLGHRIELTEPQAEQFDVEALRDGREPVPIEADQCAAVRTREQRFRKQLWMRRLGLGKPHKPKLLSANFAVSWSMYSRVNGFDEAYTGYGQEDDDLGRRLYKAGSGVALGLTQATVYHLWHPTRAPGTWHDSPNAARFAQPFEIRCTLGLDTPADQPPVTVERFGTHTAQPAEPTTTPA